MSERDQKNSTSAFYDLRGRNAMAASSAVVGSEKFPAHLSGPYECLEEKLTTIFGSHQGQPRLLDIGCGTGVHTLPAARTGYQVVGVDISPQSIEAAKKYARELALQDRSEFFETPAEEFLQNQESESFDVVMVTGSFYYLDRHGALENIQRVLKPGGHFLAVETSGSNLPMNALRRLRHLFLGHRDQQTLQRLILLSELRDWQRYFDNTSLDYFGGTSLAAALFKGSKGLYRGYLKKSLQWDEFLLAKTPSLAFKFLFHGQKGEA